jgi:hypothetical protein
MIRSPYIFFLSQRRQKPPPIPLLVKEGAFGSLLFYLWKYKKGSTGDAHKPIGLAFLPIGLGIKNISRRRDAVLPPVGYFFLDKKVAKKSRPK